MSPKFCVWCEVGVQFHFFAFGYPVVSAPFIERRRQWHPTPVLLPGKSHGWRSLEGCSPWGRWGSDMTERLPFHFSLSCIGEGNGSPLQCSCLVTPRDGGAWWAAVYGVAQSRTRLKRLSSSSIYWKDFVELSWHPCQKLTDFISYYKLTIIQLICVSSLLPVPHHLDYCSFVVSYEIVKIWVSWLCCFSRFYFVYSESLAFPYEF